MLFRSRALEVVAPGGREFLDWGKVGVNRIYETRCLQSTQQELLALYDRIKRDFQFTSLYFCVRAS